MKYDPHYRQMRFARHHTDPIRQACAIEPHPRRRTTFTDRLCWIVAAVLLVCTVLMAAGCSHPFPDKRKPPAVTVEWADRTVCELPDGRVATCRVASK